MVYQIFDDTENEDGSWTDEDELKYCATYLTIPILIFRGMRLEASGYSQNYMLAIL